MRGGDWSFLPSLFAVFTYPEDLRGVPPSCALTSRNALPKPLGVEATGIVGTYPPAPWRGVVLHYDAWRLTV